MFTRKLPGCCAVCSKNRAGSKAGESDKRKAASIEWELLAKLESEFALIRASGRVRVQLFSPFMIPLAFKREGVESLLQ
jgi:hypothetical protein